ncbi:3-isopropylmalate dehydratase large subunit (plasmid) [Paraburkholderia sp. PREW-6R]|uniref:3-isopropylmalate dehydratase large subunit n=1 Tax=Paraburkholderia sp. PREW-6R TaxID=3141544 RepID=UPI0031F4C809
MNDATLSDPSATARTFFQKIWDDHVIEDFGDGSYLLQIDRLFLHEVSGGVALRELHEARRATDSPRQVFTAIDHVVNIYPGRRPGQGRNDTATSMIAETVGESARHGLQVFQVGDPRQGIVHVISPELGLALPGLTLVCGDSHTCTVGGVGTLGWGVGSTEGVHVLATQTLVQPKPKTMRVWFDGALPAGVHAKDMALHLIARIGANGGIGYAIEFAGEAVEALPVEGRLTLCNMAIECAARYAFVAPDDATYAYLAGREYTPSGAAWDEAVAYWKTLPSDPGAQFDSDIHIDCTQLAPQITWGTSPQHSAAIDGAVPAPGAFDDEGARALVERALAYQHLTPGTRYDDIAVDVAYIGSCTNARLSDLQVAADVLRGRKVADGVTAICVPGSSRVKAEAEALGIDAIFRAAGFEWLESGCAMCATGGADRLGGKRVVSTTNRNFENRQGPKTRTHLASPATVAASAVLGHLADARALPRTADAADVATSPAAADQSR